MGSKCAHITYDFGILGDAQEAEKLRSFLDTALEGKDVAILINNVAEFQVRDSIYLQNISNTPENPLNLEVKILLLYSN